MNRSYEKQILGDFDMKKQTLMTLIIPTLIVALTPFYFSSATADPIKKVLTLSVGRSHQFLKDVPKLSLSNGPLAEDETSIGLEIDMEAFLNFFANYKDVKKENDFFREARNFRDGRAEFIVKHVDGTITSKTFSLAPNAPVVGIVELSELLFDVNAKVTGAVDVYKCFNATTCVFEETKAKQLFVEEEKVSVKHNFRGLVGCHTDARIEGGIDHPEIQRIVINPTIARMISLEPIITAKSEPVQTGAEFKGFIANLENFGMTNGQQNPRTTLEVTRVNDKLQLRVLTQTSDEVKILSGYDFERCGNYP